MIPNILSIAGSDPSGGAGVQADVKAISANGGYAMAVIAALTAQNTKGVTDVHPIPAAFVASQIVTIFADIAVHAVKIGMLGGREIVEVVADALAGLKAPIVLDPVMVAKGGDRLLAETAVTSLRERLVPLATIITPNLPEAADLLEQPEARSREEMLDQAQALLRMGPKAVYLKGGHLSGDNSPDLLLTHEFVHWMDAKRVRTANTHGTGCTLSSALATQLAITGDLSAAAEAAKTYTRKAISAAGNLVVGGGHGPTDHFFDLRS